jgi:hypothetical protein
MALKKKTSKEAQLWNPELLEEVPTDKSSEGKRASSRRLIRWYVMGACVLFPVALLGSLSGWMEASAYKPAVEAPSISSPAKGAAMKAVTAWVSTNPSPVPGGVVQSWDGFKRLETVVLDNGKPSPTIEIHTMTVISSTGNLYTTSIQMSYSDTSGVQVIGAPSLMPYAPDGTIVAGMPWPGKKSVSAPESVNDAVEVWANAYTSGNPSTLRQTVGDPEQAHAYVPLSGIKSIKSVAILEAAGKPTDAEEKEGVRSPENIVARVTFEVLWAGQTTGTSKITYDVLVAKANSGSPVVVAWGGPGEGFSLEPFSNALIGRDVVTDADLAKKLEDEAKKKTAEPTTPAATPVVVAPETASEEDSSNE